MKGIFKFTTAALALVAFASCSNDNLFGEAQQVQQAKGDIYVEVEDLLDPATTRAAYTPNGKTGSLNFNTGDNIKITDGTLVKYDFYKFQSGAFVFDKTKTGRDAAWIEEPEYASYNGNGKEVGMQWDNAKKQAIGTYQISANPTWSEDAETEGAFGAEIPLWGTAQADDTYGVKVSMKYLTGILKINLENVPGNADEIIVEGFKNLSGTDEAPMTGTFKAIMANDDEINENAFLDPATGTGVGNKITVDVSKAKKASSVLFIPLIAQKYGLLNISYKKGVTTKLIKAVENLTVERRKYYNLTYSSFKVAGDKPSDISAFLAEKKAESDIKIETANATTLVDETSAGAGDMDYTIEVPKTSANITLELAGVKAATTGKILYIKGEEFTGTLTVNVKANDGPTPVSNIYVDMPNANVVITGAGMATIDLGKDKDLTDNVAGGVVAKTLTLGTTDAPATFKAVHANAELGYYNTTGSDLLLVKGSTLKALDFETNYKADVIEINGTLSANLDMSTWKTKEGKNIVSSLIIGNGANTQDIQTFGDVTVTGGTVKNIVTDGDVSLSGVTDATAGTTAATVGTIYPLSVPSAVADAINKTITVDGEAKVNVNITEKTNNKFNLIVKGKGSVVGGTATSVKDLTINGTSASVGQVKVSGDATITDTEECEAITTSLTMNEGQTLTMNGGYIKALTVNNNDATKVLTIQHGTTAGYTAIGGITATGSYKISGTSKWNGKAVGGGLDATKDAAKITALKNVYGDKAKTEIYTATELASIGTGAGTAAATVTLKSNIDLDAQAWTSPVLTATTAFTGANLGTAEAPVYPTINKLNLAAAANTANGDITGVGLFKSAAGTISNLNITNVTSTITEANDKNVTNVGVIAGSTSGALTISNVKITSANVGATVADHIGGLVGYSANNLTLTKVSVTGLTLNGQFYIGGVVGDLATGKKLTFTTGDGNGTSISVTAINVPTTFNAEPKITVVPANKTEYGTVGMVTGQSDVTGTAIVNPAQLTVNDLITGNRQKLGFKMCYEDAGPNLVYYYGMRGDDHTKQHTWIGRVIGATSAKKLTKADFDAAYTTPTGSIMVKHDIYDDCDK